MKIVIFILLKIVEIFLFIIFPYGIGILFRLLKIPVFDEEENNYHFQNWVIGFWVIIFMGALYFIFSSNWVLTDKIIQYWGVK